MSMTNSSDRVEIITSVQRRRRWTAPEKVRMVFAWSKRPSSRVALGDPCRKTNSFMRETDGSMIALDFQSLSLFRIAFSLYLLCDFFIAAYPFLNDLYGESGVLPVAALAADADRPGLVLVLPFIKILNLLCPLTLFAVPYSVALISFMLGYRTRLSAVLIFISNSYLYWRNPYLDSGADTLARLLLLWCLFLPMGRYWSADAALDTQPRTRPYPILPFLALRVQISSLYLFSAFFKFAGVPWRDGTALTWALSDDVFGATPFGLLLVRHAPWLLYIVNYLVIAFQLTFPFLIYCPWRNDLTRAVALVGSVLMHTSFIIFLNIGGFPYLCLAMLILLVPDSWINRLVSERRARLAGITIYYEPGCGFCQRVSLILREFLLCPASHVLPASIDPEAQRLLTTNNSWVVRGSDGTPYLKWRAVAYLFSQNSLLAPLAWLSERKLLRERLASLYDLIGSNRRRFGSLAKGLFPFRHERAVGRLALILCGILMLFAFLSNVAGLARLKFPLVREFDQVTAALQVRQSWDLFAPAPVHFRREYRILARTADGSTIDVMQLLPGPPLRSSPDRDSISFTSPRWTKYFTRFDVFTEAAWTAFGQYLCRQSSARMPHGPVIKQVHITLIEEPIPGTPPAFTPTIGRLIDCTPPAT